MADLGLIDAVGSEPQTYIADAPNSNKQNNHEAIKNNEKEQNIRDKKQPDEVNRSIHQRSPLKQIGKQNVQALLIDDELIPGMEPAKEQIIQKVSQDEKVCLVHNKLRDIVCTVDMEIVCSNCAIFCHKGHDFKSLSDFEMDKLKHCQALVDITDVKKKLEESISGKTAVNMAKERFEVIRNQLIQQLKAKFRCLQQQLQLAQQRCIEKINKGIGQEEDRIKSLMSIPSRIEESYKRWEIDSYDQMRIFEFQDTKAQMAILNYDRKQQTNFIDKGKTLIEDIRSYLNKLNLKTEQAYGCFILDFDVEIEKKLSVIHETVLRKFRKAALHDQVSDMSFTRLNTQSKLEITIPEEQLLQDKVPFRSPFAKDSAIGYHYQSQQTQSRIFIPHTVRMARQPSIFQSNFKDSISTLAVNENLMISTIKIQNSPPKQFVLPSPRNFLSPTKHREITVDSKLKKLLTKLKLPQKYYRMVISIIYEGVQTLDLTNCGLDESVILTLLQILKSSKNLRVLKLIRNRLTDEAVERLVVNFPKVMVLNLSQNNLTEKTFEILTNEMHNMTNLKTIVLTQNKIKEKGAKGKLEELRRNNINVIM